MGNWTIQIRGVGAHHNGLPGDVDALGKLVLQVFAAAGHSVSDADITVAPAESLLPSVTAVGSPAASAPAKPPVSPTAAPPAK